MPIAEPEATPQEHAPHGLAIHLEALPDAL
jgi:hypothetical protein